MTEEGGLKSSTLGRVVHQPGASASPSHPQDTQLRHQAPGGGLGLLKCEHRMLVYDEVHDVEREFAVSSVFAATRC